MNYSSGESRKSKYEASSRKINALFQEFQQLRQRINVPRPPSQQRQNEGIPSEIKSPPKLISGRKLFQQRQFSETGKKPPTEPPLQREKSGSFNSIIRRKMERTMEKILEGPMVKAKEKVEVMEGKLEYLGSLFHEVSRLVKIKIDNTVKLQKIRGFDWQSKVIEIKEIEKKYENRIKSLSDTYENKISLILQQVSRNKDYSSTQATSPLKSLKDTLKNMEQDLINKDNELTEIKLENSRGRRQIQRLSDLMKKKEQLLKELSSEIQDKSKVIMNFQVQLKTKQEELNQMKQLNKGENVEKLNQKLLEQKAQLQASNKHLQHSLIKMNKSLQDCGLKNFDDRFEQVVSEEEYEDIMNIRASNNMDHLTHSHLIHDKGRKIQILQARLKEVETDLELMIQENKILKQKSDRLEQQTKDNEEDEQKFQTQSHILKEQLKRLNSNLNILDECAIMLLYAYTKLPAQKIQQLDPSIRFRQEYEKKNQIRQRSNSKASHQSGKK